VWQAEFKLYLYPNKIDYKIDSERLLALLKKEELISKKLSDKRYATGDKFVSLLTFMGCSPDIELEPQKDKPYCYIEIESHNKPQFISGSNLKKARCPHCKKEISEPTLCSNCQAELNPLSINWRKTAFLAQSWIAIGNIYELEAIPNDQFLNTLEKHTGVKWKPAYIRYIKD